MLDCAAAEQLALFPPPDPTQLQSQGPSPTTSVGVPAEQSPLMGADLCIEPFAGPQAPSTIAGASQDIFRPFAVEQVHVHGPLPLTADGLPSAQRPVAGASVVPLPAASPHFGSPSACSAFFSIGAEQKTVEEGLVPLHSHFQ